MISAKNFVILGPTCTGKTSLGLKLCQKFNGVIISADSRQMIRHMDIGTGKIPVSSATLEILRTEAKWVLSDVDVYGYDLVDPDQYFSAHDFLNYCQKTFPRASLNGKNVFVVGGTGFYIDALTGKIPLAGVGPDLELRKYLEILTLDQLGQKLLELNSEVYQKIDLKNPARVIRAIEKSLTREVSREKQPLLTEPIYIGLTGDRKILYERADAWVDAVFGAGLFDEVANIQKQFPKSHRLTGLIYKSAVSYLSSQTTLEEANQRAKFDMHAYIRRQQTWFKRDPAITWFDILDPNFDDRVVSLVESKLHGR